MDLVMAEKHIRSRIGTHLLPRIKNSQMEQQLELAVSEKGKSKAWRKGIEVVRCATT
jgi:hypothetical protein